MKILLSIPSPFGDLNLFRGCCHLLINQWPCFACKSKGPGRSCGEIFFMKKEDAMKGLRILLIAV